MTTASPTLRSMLVVILLAALAPVPTALAADEPEPPVDPALFQGMEWRNVGPFRGGRVTAVAGVIQDPYTYYFGATGGGVWKTGDAGTTWTNVSDGFFETGSVGALAVAPSDPNVVYAGMGEAPVRGVTTSHGDGVYRSTDAGRTWTHLGLEATRQISAIEVHPSDPDTVYVAAQGSPWKDTPERGVYRSTDGGVTWELVLHVSDDAGASDLSMDPTNPRILYAAFWDHRRKPWLVRSGGPDSGVWKTADGGATWERLGAEKSVDEGGLPELMGKIGVAAAPGSGQGSGRVWAMIEADDGGLFRSDDGGETWMRVNDERVLRARAWYYTHVFADPVDPETVYVLNAPFMKSTDGGRTFSRVRTPHGDNHALWINPRDHRFMINGNDGGGNVSLNGGATWSTQANQPTAQFYRVDVDRRFPYHLYGGQQDNSAIAIASAAPGGIGRQDWSIIGGCESAHVAFDPDDPVLTYAGCYQGLIDEHHARTDRVRSIMAVPFLAFGVEPKDYPYRFNWNAPIEVSPQDPSVLYHGANVLLKSEDRGLTWTEISPDLTRDEEDKQGLMGEPITNESAGGEVYNTIFYVAPSPHDEGTIWVGTDDGLIHVTRDGGATWSDVTPPGIGEAQINALEVSPHEPGAAYAAVTRYKLGDYTPLAFKTTDHGASWTRITDGIAEEDWVRVVREDPERRGLLYAGTETGLYVSFDDGERWQPFQLDLPVVPVTDLQVAGDDLVAATQGRAFWILDDLAPVRQATEAAGSDLHLYRPAPAVRAGFGGGFGGLETDPEGENPPPGAVIDYVLSEALAGSAEAEDPAEPMESNGEEAGMDDGATEEAGAAGSAKITLEIRDADGAVVRSFASVPEEGRGRSAGPGGPAGGPFGGGGPELLSAEPGMNRFVWNLRAEGATEIPGLTTFGGAGAPRVPPGTYTVRLVAERGEGEALEATRELRVLEDPRIDTESASYAEQQALLAEIRETLDALNDGVLRARRVREQVEQQVARVKDLAPAGDSDGDPDGGSSGSSSGSSSGNGADAIAEDGEALAGDLTAWEESVIQTKTTNFQDIINFPNRLNAQITFLFAMVDGSGPPVTTGAKERFEAVRELWREREAALDRLLGEEVDAFNELVREHAVPAVVVPPTDDDREDGEAGMDEAPR